MSMKKKNPQLSLQDVDNFADFKINDVEKYPNNLTCYLKMKIFDALGVKGTGCLIGPTYLLTSAHNVTGIDNFKQTKPNQQQYEFDFIVKQAMRDRDPKCSYKVLNWRTAKGYNPKERDNVNFDYALMIIQPLDHEQIQLETKFMPILALDPATLKKVQQFQVYGYPVQVNKNVNQHLLNKVDLDQTSFYMKDMYKVSGGRYKSNIKQEKDKKQQQIDHGIRYLLPTDKGFSGGAIVTQHKEEPVIIGVHMGTNFAKKDSIPIKPKQSENDGSRGFNVGVTARSMLEQLNQWGYELEKKPFVFTEKTLSLRQNDKIITSQILFLLNKSLQKEDILVITAFDLKHLKSITLTGNHIKEEGFLYLTKRQYPNLQSLFATDNQIESLDKLPEQHWKNISTVKTLGLSVNSLTSLPEKITLLENIEKLWLTYNKFTQIPLSLCALCENIKQKPKIYLYKNAFKSLINDQKLNRLKLTKATIIQQKQAR